jgi:hypothetical protein
MVALALIKDIWPLSRIYGKFCRAQRKPSGDDECQFYHPVCNVPWLDGRLVRMKSARQHKAFTMKEFTGKKGWPDLDSSRVLPLYASGIEFTVDGASDHCAHRETMKGYQENCPKAGASDALAEPVNAEQLLSD